MPSNEGLEPLANHVASNLHVVCSVYRLDESEKTQDPLFEAWRLTRFERATFEVITLNALPFSYRRRFWLFRIRKSVFCQQF